MIIVAPIVYLEHKSSTYLQYEYYRLINVIYKDGNGSWAICERLSDAKEGDTVIRKNRTEYHPKKGDLIEMEIDCLRVVHNSEHEEKERERENYIKELAGFVK